MSDLKPFNLKPFNLKSSEKKQKKQKLTEVACGVMYNKEGKILMGLRPPGNLYPGIWEFPGGSREPNETIEDCLRREWKEELNLNIQIEKEIYSTTFGKYYCRFFVGVIIDEENVIQHIHEKITLVFPFEIPTLRLFEGDEVILQYL